MILTTTIDALAKVIHESRNPSQPWEELPSSPQNPQRYYARRTAQAVLEFLGAEPAVVSETFNILLGEGKNEVADSIATMRKVVGDL